MSVVAIPLGLRSDNRQPVLGTQKESSLVVDADEEGGEALIPSLGNYRSLTLGELWS